MSEIPRLMGQALADHSWQTGLVALLMAALDYFVPGDVARSMLIGLGVLIGVDWVTGVRAASIEGRVSSVGLWKTGDKLIGYGSLIAVFAVVGRHVPGMESYMGMGLAGIETLMITREAVSILENIVRMGIDLPFGWTDRLKQKLASINNSSGPEAEKENNARQSDTT